MARLDLVGRFGPSHGTLSFGATASAGSTDITPVTITIRQPPVMWARIALQSASDATANATRTITVTVNFAPVFVGANPTMNVTTGAGATDVRLNSGCG